MSKYVQYIVFRKDLVEQMGKGKIASQSAHASLSVLVEKKKQIVIKDGKEIKIEKVELVDNPIIEKWFNGHQSKIVVYVRTKQKLLNLAEKLDIKGIRTKLIFDACYTILEPEEENGTTLTCMGVIPMEREKVPKCLQILRLLD